MVSSAREVGDLPVDLDPDLGPSDSAVDFIMSFAEVKELDLHPASVAEANVLFLAQPQVDGPVQDWRGGFSGGGNASW